MEFALQHSMLEWQLKSPITVHKAHGALPPPITPEIPDLNRPPSSPTYPPIQFSIVPPPRLRRASPAHSIPCCRSDPVFSTPHDVPAHPRPSTPRPYAPHPSPSPRDSPRALHCTPRIAGRIGRRNYIVVSILPCSSKRARGRMGEEKDETYQSPFFRLSQSCTQSS